MDVRLAPGPTRWCVRGSVVDLAALVLASAMSAAAFAQQPPEAQSLAAAPQQLQLIYSPWMKFCFKRQEDNGQQVCFTGEDGKVESGMPVVSAVLIEREGEAKKMLRVTLPLGMQLPQGTRIIVDRGQPMNGPYVICLANACVADYEASEELIATMKRGQWLVVQGFNNQGQGISLFLPLNDFSKAYDGPPTDPKVFEDRPN
jgi:invasion protein IalB